MFAIIATCVSSSAMSMCCPVPLTSRRAIAASTATVEYIPVIRSDTATPTFCGPPPGRIVAFAGHAHQTAEALDDEVVAGAFAYGPVWPKPVTEQ
jgi:hypothetical protein